MTVIDLAQARAARQPTFEGPCACLECGHRWESERPQTGRPEWLTCPACGLDKGRPMGAYERSGPHWVCNCGNDLFQLMPGGAYCPHCSAWFTPADAVGQLTDWAREQVTAFERSLASTAPGAGFGAEPSDDEPA